MIFFVVFRWFFTVFMLFLAAFMRFYPLKGGLKMPKVSFLSFCFTAFFIIKIALYYQKGHFTIFIYPLFAIYPPLLFFYYPKG